MKDDFQVFIFLLVVGFVGYIIFANKEAEKRRAEERRIAEEKEKERKAEYERQKKIYQELRSAEISKPLPSYIQSALDTFIKESKAGADYYQRFHDFSPLACFGYRVGKTNGLPEKQRREIIYFTWYATIPLIIPQKYAEEWGDPGTYKRFSKIHAHLTMLAKQREGRKNYEVAVSHWNSDADWLNREHGELAKHYQTYGF